MATRTDVELIIKARDEATAGLKRVAGSVDELGNKTTGLGKVFDNIGTGAARALGGVVVAGATAAAAGVAAFGIASIDAAATFEQSLSSIEAVSGATAAQMEEISGLALQLGADTAFSAQEAAAGLEELIKGGLSVGDAMAAAKPMLDLAAAGGLGVAESAEIAANAIGIFSLAGADMTNVANQIAGAANASSLSVTDFQYSMSAAGAVAAGVGQSFDDLATAIAIMGKNGLKGSDAGTSLKTMLMNLQPTTKAQIQTFKDLGIVTLDNQKLMEAFAQQGLDPALAKFEDAEEILKKHVTGWDGVKAMTAEQKDIWAQASRELGIYNNAFINADGSFKSNAEIAEVLQESTRGLTDAQRALALETMFGADAIRAANVFIKEGAEGFDAMAGAMGNVTAASVAATKLDNFKGSLDAMRGSVETLQIVLATALLPMLTSLVADYLTPAINGATTFAQAFFDAGDKVGFMVTAINGVLPGFQQLVTWLQQNWTLLTQIATAVGVVIAVFSGLSMVASVVGSLALAWGTLTTSVATAGSVIGGVVAILGGPVTVAIGLVAAAVGALYLAWTTDFMGIQTSLTDWWNSTGSPIFTQLQNWLATAIPAAIAALAGFWTGTLQPAMSTVWTFITGSVIPTLTTLATTVFTAVQTGIATLATFWTGTLLPAITTVWEFINGSVVPLLTSLAGVTIAALGVALEAMAGIWQNVVQPALQAVWNKANEVATLFSGALSTAITTVSGFFETTLLPVITTAGNTIGTVLGPAINTVTGFFNTWYTAIGGVSGAISTVIGWLDNLASKLNTIDLPDWMTPGSPTPWEIGMWGVARATGAATGEVAALGVTLNRLDRTGNPVSSALAAVPGRDTGDPAAPWLPPTGEEVVAPVAADAAAIQALWSAEAWAPTIEAVRVTWQTIVTVMHDMLAAAWAYQDSVTSLMGADISTLMKKIDALIGKINSIPSIPSGGGGSPMYSFDSGVQNFGGGLAKVHGGEVITYLPRGSNVYTARDVQRFERMMDASTMTQARGVTINGGIHITLGSGAPRDQARSFLSELRSQGVDL